jgi:hypothetical protein
VLLNEAEHLLDKDLASGAFHWGVFSLPLLFLFVVGALDSLDFIRILEVADQSGYCILLGAFVLEKHPVYLRLKFGDFDQHRLREFGCCVLVKGREVLLG